MRQCDYRQPSAKSATQDPRLHEVGRELAVTYGDLLQQPLPEAMKRLAACLPDRTDISKQRKDD